MEGAGFVRSCGLLLRLYSGSVSAFADANTALRKNYISALCLFPASLGANFSTALEAPSALERRLPAVARQAHNHSRLGKVKGNRADSLDYQNHHFLTLLE